MGKYNLNIVFLILSICFITSCSGGDYLAEKYLFKANKKVESVDLQTASVLQFTELIHAFEIVTSRWPLSSKAADAHIAISNLYVLQKDYHQARGELEKVVLNFSNKKTVAANARFSIGKLYELEKNFSQAAKVYRELYDILPTTRRGLMSPIYIAEMYKKNGDSEKALKAYDDALKHYTHKFNEFGEIKSGAIFKNYIALCYASQGLWEQAISNWEELIAMYPTIELVAPTYLTLGDIYFSQLKERTRAISAYLEVINKFPETEYQTKAYAKLIQIYFVTGEYTSAISYAQKLISSTENAEIQAQAEVIIARSVEKQGDWAKAEEMYKNIMEKYVDTVASLKVPLLLAQHYQGADQSEAVDRVYQEAIENYQTLMSNTDTSVQVKQNAFDMTTLIYAKQENWDQIIADMMTIYNDENESVNKRSRSLFVSAFVYHTKIGNVEQATLLYEEFLSTFPNHPFGKIVQMHLDKIKNGE